jgi:hypothetical protein
MTCEHSVYALKLFINSKSRSQLPGVGWDTDDALHENQQNINMGFRGNFWAVVLSAAFLAACGVNKNSFDALTSSGAGGGGGNDTGLGSGKGPTIGSGLQPPAPPAPFQNTNCALGYTASAGAPRTPADVVFNESDVLVAFSPQTTVQVTPGLTVNVWYSDEHAMTLGVRQVSVITSSGTTTTNYPISSLSGNPGVQGNPQVGSTALTGDVAGVDTSTCTGVADSCSRPMWPSLFVTDITANASSRAGDWQSGGIPLSPSAIYGTWKGAVRTVDKTQNPPRISVIPDADPAPNNWNLGSGIPTPPGVFSEGFTTLVSWNVAALGLQSGHSYRLQFMVHDGDQHYTGGDVGENCVNLTVP